MSTERAAAFELPTSYKGEMFTESCWQCGSPSNRPVGDCGPVFCSVDCEEDWARGVADGE